MTYLIIWNGQKYWEEKISAKTWEDFIKQLTYITLNIHKQPPDLIYLKEFRP